MFEDGRYSTFIINDNGQTVEYRLCGRRLLTKNGDPYTTPDGGHDLILVGFYQPEPDVKVLSNLYPEPHERLKMLFLDETGVGRIYSSPAVGAVEVLSRQQVHAHHTGPIREFYEEPDFVLEETEPESPFPEL